MNFQIRNIVFLGLFISLCFSIIFNYYFEKKGLIKSNEKISIIFEEDVVKYYIPFAEKIRQDLKTKNYFESGHEYVNSYLQPRIFYIYNFFFNKNISFFDERNLRLKNYIWYLVMQNIFFYFTLFCLIKSLSLFFEKKILIIFTCITSLNPLFFQWQSSFMTEGLYLSFINLFLIMIIYIKRNIFYFFIIGFLIGIMYLQRTVSLLLPIILILILINNKESFFNIFKFSISTLSGLFLILFS